MTPAMTRDDATPQMTSARPALTAAIMRETGLDEQVLRELVYNFYDQIRRDPVLGPIFEARISDWGVHLERMVSFWSSVALMTGGYHGRPVPAHAPLPVGPSHFDRWLEIFRATARETCTPAGAAHVIERAERIARSLLMAVSEAQAAPGAVPMLR